MGLRRGALLAGLTALALGVAAGAVLAGGVSWLSALAGLAGWVSGSRATPALSMASGRSQLGHRVERLLSAEDRVRTSRGVLVLACAALCLLISAIPGLSVPAGSSIRVDSDPPGDLATAAPTGREGHRVRIVIEQVDR